MVPGPLTQPLADPMLWRVAVVRGTSKTLHKAPQAKVFRVGLAEASRLMVTPPVAVVVQVVLAAIGQCRSRVMVVLVATLDGPMGLV